MRILVIEDNRTTTDYLCRGLKENFFIPDIAHDGQEGLFLATNKALTCHQQQILFIKQMHMPIDF